jgi:cell division protein FtsL
MMFKVFTLGFVSLALTGCAGMHTLNSDVSSYGSWPAERKAATYAFERLPSQQEHPDQHQRVEAAARTALQTAGFTPAASAEDAQFKVLVGARVGGYDRMPYYDPFWRNVSIGYGFGFHRGFGRSRFGLGLGAGYYGYGPAGYEREVALLIRDQKTGQLLYETRASNSGVSSNIDPLLPAMFSAAMKDFPAGGPNPRSVNVELSRQ